MRDSRAKKGRRSLRAAQEGRDAGVKMSLSPQGFPPPSPRIDIDNRLPAGMGAVGAPAVDHGRGRGGSALARPVDLDVASAGEIEALPRIGAALAGRIIASRDSFGPFRSLEGLRRVRGIGPVMLRQLGPLVTFSGRAASSEVRTR
jgi:hypothetical protein